MTGSRPRRAGFTLIELIAVIVVLAILAGVALPKYFDYAAQAKESATKGTLGGVRAGVANFYANTALTEGTARYPTFAEIAAVGTVMQEALPDNPYNDDNSVRDGDTTWSAPAGTAQATSGTNGWAYDESAGKFWANSATTTENTW